MASSGTAVEKADEWIVKELSKLIHRIERILVPSNSLVHSTIGSRLESFLRRIKRKEYFLPIDEAFYRFKDVDGCDVKNLEVLARKVDWNSLETALFDVIRDGDANFIIPHDVINELEVERGVHEGRFQKALTKENARALQVSNVSVPLESTPTLTYPGLTQMVESK